VRAIFAESTVEHDGRAGGMAAVFGGDDPAGAQHRRVTDPEAAEALARRLREFYGRPGQSRSMR